MTPRVSAKNALSFTLKKDIFLNMDFAIDFNTAAFKHGINEIDIKMAFDNNIINLRNFYH